MEKSVYVMEKYGIKTIEKPLDATRIKTYEYGTWKEVQIEVFQTKSSQKFFKYYNIATGLSFYTLDQSVFGIASMKAQQYNEYNREAMKG